MLLIRLPLEVQACIVSLLEGSHFAALRQTDKAHAGSADDCVRFMLAQLRSAVVAYGTKEHARVLDCSELAIWPLSSGAIPIVEPTGLGELLSPSMPLLEHWLRGGLVRRLERLNEISNRQWRGKPEKATAVAVLKHLHVRAVFRFGKWREAVSYTHLTLPTILLV